MESSSHILVPKHSVASESEVRVLLEQFEITVDKLPIIKLSDPALASLQVRPGDVVKIARASPVTEKDENFYRRVVE